MLCVGEYDGASICVGLVCVCVECVICDIGGGVCMNAIVVVVVCVLVVCGCGGVCKCGGVCYCVCVLGVVVRCVLCL